MQIGLSIEVYALVFVKISMWNKSLEPIELAILHELELQYKSIIRKSGVHQMCV